MPTTDTARRVAEFQQYAEQITPVLVRTPPLRGDALVTAIHLVRDWATFRGPLSPDHFPMGKFWNDWLVDWPDGDSFPIAPTAGSVGGVDLLFLTAAPPGRLKGACFFGGARP
jgi:hypothetical protein